MFRISFNKTNELPTERKVSLHKKRWISWDLLSREGVRANPKILESIKDFKKLKKCQSIKSQCTCKYMLFENCVQ
jgi:hypothetical protein